MSKTCAAVAVMALARCLPAHAAPDPTAPAPLTAVDVADAPRPGEEHGRADPLDPGDGVGRRLGRLVLWIPRLAVELAMQPVRGVIYLQARKTGELVEGDENPERVIGFRPRFLWQTGFNPHVSLRAALRNLFGRREEVGIRVGDGGHVGTVIGVDATTGTRLGKLALGVEARYDSRDDERFFGFGNGDEVDPAARPPLRIDPILDATAVPTRYERRGRRAGIWAKYTPVTEVQITATGEAISKTFKVSDDPRGGDVSIEQAYDLSRVPSFLGGAELLRGELEVAYDSRRSSDPYDSPAIRSTGTLVLGHASRVQGLEGAADFYRYGIDLQQDFRLTAGPRVLELRLAGDAITGDLDEVPFTEVPELGGDLLRAAAVDRYRDRVALVGRVSYLFALGPRVAGVVFGESGRVYRDLSDLTLDALRYGGGIGIEGYTVEQLFFRAEVAASADGDAFFTLAFVPAQDGRSRVTD